MLKKFFSMVVCIAMLAGVVTIPAFASGAVITESITDNCTNFDNVWSHTGISLNPPEDLAPDDKDGLWGAQPKVDSELIFKTADSRFFTEIKMSFYTLGLVDVIPVIWYSLDGVNYTQLTKDLDSAELEYPDMDPELRNYWDRTIPASGSNNWANKFELKAEYQNAVPPETKFIKITVAILRSTEGWYVGVGDVALTVETPHEIAESITDNCADFRNTWSHSRVAWAADSTSYADEGGVWKPNRSGMEIVYKSADDKIFTNVAMTLYTQNNLKNFPVVSYSADGEQYTVLKADALSGTVSSPTEDNTGWDLLKDHSEDGATSNYSWRKYFSLPEADRVIPAAEKAKYIKITLVDGWVEGDSYLSIGKVELSVEDIPTEYTVSVDNAGSAVAVRSNGTGTETAVLLIAEYETGKALLVNSQAYDVNFGNGSESVTQFLGSIGTDTYFKAFLWNSLSGLIPLGSSGDSRTSQ